MKMEKSLKRAMRRLSDAETNDASEAAPADTEPNEDEGSVQSDAGDTLETETTGASSEDDALSTPSQNDSNQATETSNEADSSSSTGRMHLSLRLLLYRLSLTRFR